MTQDEIKEKAATLGRLNDSPPVVLWKDAVKAIREDLIIQSYNEKGEEAVRALGVLKGIDIALNIDKVYKARVTQ